MIAPYTADQPLIDGGPGQLQISAVSDTLVVLGRASRVEREIKLERCLVDGVQVVQRRGGGCAVVLAPGMVTLGLTLKVEAFGQNLAHFARISSWLAAGLARVGAPGVYQDGISDLVLADRKVGGACIYRRASLLYYSASLVVEIDDALLERYLEHPPREPAYRRGRSHREFVGDLSCTGLGDEALAAALRKTLDLAALETTN